jgi:hypothetical protein
MDSLRRREARRRTWRPWRRFVVLVLLVGLGAAAFVAGCGGQQSPPSSASSTSTASTTAVATTNSASRTSSATSAIIASSTAASTTAVSTGKGSGGVSSDSIAYAQSLGGTSHEGETLQLVIGALLDSEQAAQATLLEATARFGDMQSYFIVQLSDNFEGMEPGWWVILEAYWDEPSPENLDFDRRGFPEAYVTSATVMTSDPIPLYEDMVGVE